MARTKESPVELWEDLSHEKWQVQHGATGKPRLMTVEEIDAAFKRDEVNARTLVRKQGSLKWRTLAEIAGLEEQVNHQLESESLMPVTSEIIIDIDVVNPVIPKPPPLPRQSSQDAIPTARVDVPDLAARAVVMEEEEEEENKKPTLVPGSDDVMVKPEPGEEGAIFHLTQPSKRRQQSSSVVDHAEQRRRTSSRSSSSSTGSKLVGVAMVALLGGGVFAGVSAWLVGSFDRPMAASSAPAAARATPPPTAAAAMPASPPESSVKTLPTVTVEGSVLVLAPTTTSHAPAATPTPTPTPTAHAPAPSPKSAPAAVAAKQQPVAPAPKPTQATVGLKIDAKKALIGKGPQTPPPSSHAKAKR